jgi:hypothetical protein
MWLLLLEALIALAVLGLIVGWTMLGARRADAARPGEGVDDQPPSPPP